MKENELIIFQKINTDESEKRKLSVEHASKFQLLQQPHLLLHFYCEITNFEKLFKKTVKFVIKKERKILLPH